jgi:hypothetical protein
VATAFALDRMLARCAMWSPFKEMVPADGERVVAGGLVFLMLDCEGRILVDYLFVLPNAAAA